MMFHDHHELRKSYIIHYINFNRLRHKQKASCQDCQEIMSTSLFIWSLTTTDPHNSHSLEINWMEQVIWNHKARTTHTHCVIRSRDNRKQIRPLTTPADAVLSHIYSKRCEHRLLARYGASCSLAQPPHTQHAHHLCSRIPRDTEHKRWHSYHDNNS